MIKPDIVARRIGSEGQPIAIVDGFHPDPDALRAAALAARFEPGRHHYPGIRAPLPADYFARVRPGLAPVLREVLGAASVELLDASFSMVTTPPAELGREQRLPHVDAVQPGRIALVHYLSEGEGTAFFRHRATGFETIDAARSAGYLATLNAELRTDPPEAAYPFGDTALFERIAHVEARFNRAVIYRSALLHSGAISPGALLDADPATGRLTVTAFLAAT
ncbi:hypothetical protein HNP52_002996 [Sphingomonas kyeonggiensis]|uniref:Uncharacterized protein n=1 Tax=Sphingomonas kyeonggiensis TaxID=1268553 RepID=A0A7W7K2N7_9SPHN|nr:DUF6445 family protein [Sphingomonas kyeonggiensis]MBB4839904.1 hypothetical protein [Sphingomonas kyeonggiensis]